MTALNGRVRRVALAAVVLAGVGASPALASPTVTVGYLGSLKQGAQAGTVQGVVINRGAQAVDATVAVSAQGTGLTARPLTHTSVPVAPGATVPFTVTVKLPDDLPRGNYYLAACTPDGSGTGDLGCASSEGEIAVKGGIPIRGAAVHLPPLRATTPRLEAGSSSKEARAADAPEDCSSGAHTLAQPGDWVYPDIGNGGYASLHTDVYIDYDAINNLFLPGTHVDLQQRSTQCLTDFSLDLDTSNSITSTTEPGPNLTVQSITIDGQPATWQFEQPTYPGDPNGQDDPDPLAHRTGLTDPINAANPDPPACPPTSSAAAQQNLPCPTTKLVITPAQPIPGGTDFTVTVNYTGRPGVRPSPTGTEGWFLNSTPGSQGAMVTSEPTGTEAWMPLNNYPSVKPTYDFYDTVTQGKLAIANGRLISSGDNPPDTNFPNGSTSYHWESDAPIANYLVEDSVGNFDYSFRQGADNVIYFEAQDSAISAARKPINQAAMDQQETITQFEEQFAGPFPFDTDGIVVALPSASFEEEMQTKIVFVGGTIGGSTGTNLTTFAHENFHQWFGDNVAEAAPRLMWWKEGEATTAEYFWTARSAAIAAGGQGTPAGDAAFEASLVSRFNTNYNTTSTTFWNTAPSNPTSVTMNGNSNAYVRPGTAYLALREILGPTNYDDALQDITRQYGGGSINEPELEAEFYKYIPNQSQACQSKLAQFFTQWFDTSYHGTPSAGNRPTLTGPGLAGGGFYDASGPCSATVPVTTASYAPSGTPGTALVTLAASETGGPTVASTVYTIDGGPTTTYAGPFPLNGATAHTLTFYSTDSSGDVELTNTVTVPADTTPPVTTASVSPTPTAGVLSGGPATVTLTATDAGGSGVAVTNYSVDGGPRQVYTAPFQITAGGLHTIVFASTDDFGNVEANNTLTLQINPAATSSVSGLVASTLAVSVPDVTPQLGTFTPGLAATYTSTIGATVTSTAAQALLTVADPSSTATGHLVNGAYSLPAALQAAATDAVSVTPAFGPVGSLASPLTLLSYAGPVSNDAVTIAFQQPISATDPLRTGTYSKALTVALSTSTP